MRNEKSSQVPSPAKDFAMVALLCVGIAGHCFVGWAELSTTCAAPWLYAAILWSSGLAIGSAIGALCSKLRRGLMVAALVYTPLVPLFHAVLAGAMH